MLTKKVLDALRGSIALCQRKFIFALDGFDQRFEDFRTANLSMSASDDEAKQRIHFEICWLKGLLRTVLEYRSSDNVVQDSISFCITIPQDRYLEVRSTERDDYRFRALAANLQWSAIELSILIRKRLEGLVAMESSKALPPVDRLNEVIQSKDLDLPTRIEMRIGGNVLSMSFFKYLLRHTFWRPRDMMFYVAAILANKKFARKQKKAIDHALVKEIVSRTTYDVIDTEFFKEYQNNIVNLKSVVEAFDSGPILLPYDKLESILNSVPFWVNGGMLKIDDPLDKIDLLYEIGFLGLELGARQLRSGADCRDMFVFSDGLKRYSSISSEAKKRNGFVIHPIFSEYLSLDTDVGRVICVYSDEYISRNDVLHE